MSEEEQAIAISRQSLDEQRRSNKLQRRSLIIASSAAVIAALALGLGVWNRVSQDAATVKTTRQAQEDRKAAQQATLRVEAEHVNVAKGINGDMATIHNWNPTSLDDVVLRIVLKNGEDRYARIETLKPCTTWQITDKRLREEHLRPVPESEGFIEGSEKIQVWFTDWRGGTWTKEPGQDLTAGAYRNTRANKNMPSQQFLKNSKEVAERSFIPIKDCSGGLR
ncbi:MULTISPECIES: hypothetical protein [unclassified Streptomyces]|jgi:hypothetical protein|uniref:hypothetical protein n=1 Tax=unclassified Streptomyces TaxID=2593676 RepID=UPI002E1F7C8F